MSDLQHLRESILTKATQEGQTLLAKAREEHEALFLERKDKMIREKSLEREHLLNQANQKLTRLEQQVLNEQRQELLLNRQHLVDQLINGAVAKMSEWSTEQWLSFMEKVFKQFSNGHVDLILGNHLKKTIDQESLVNLVGQFNNIHYRTEESVPGVGFILRENRIDYNFLVESMVSSLRDTLSIELTKEVFESKS